MLISENTTNFIGMEGAMQYGRKLTERWIDAISPKATQEEPEDTRSCDEIVDDIWKRAGLWSE